MLYVKKSRLAVDKYGEVDWEWAVYAMMFGDLYPISMDYSNKLTAVRDAVSIIRYCAKDGIGISAHIAGGGVIRVSHV